MKKRCELVDGLGIRILKRVADCFLSTFVLSVLVSSLYLTFSFEWFLQTLIIFYVVFVVGYVIAWSIKDNMDYLGSYVILAIIKKIRGKICKNDTKE